MVACPKVETTYAKEVGVPLQYKENIAMEKDEKISEFLNGISSFRVSSFYVICIVHNAPLNPFYLLVDWEGMIAYTFMWHNE